MPLYFYSMLLMVVVGLATAPAMAAQALWSAPGAGNWFVGTNWSPAVVPTTLDAAIVGNGGAATAIAATATGPVAVNRLEVGRNAGMGTFTSLGVAVSVDSDFDVGEIAGSFAFGPTAVTSGGFATISDASAVTVGFIGDGDFDIGQAGATLGATANASGSVTLQRIGIVDVSGDIDVAQASADATSVTHALGSLTISQVETLSIAGDLDVGPVGGAGTSNSLATANLASLPSVVIGGGIDVGIASGSSAAVNHASGRLNLQDASVTLGFADPLLPRGLRIGNVASIGSDRADTMGEVRFSSVALNAAGAFEVGVIDGTNGSNANSATASLVADGSVMQAASLSVAEIAPGVAGSSSGTLTLLSSLATFTGTALFGDGARVEFGIAGASRATAALSASAYAGIDAASAVLNGDLTVVLNAGFQPQAGQRFELFRASITGAFDGVTLPMLSPGLQWEIDASATAFAIEVITASLPGDYNSDGVVNAADYTRWRDTLGSTTTLSADGDGNGRVEQADYNIWRNNYSVSVAIAVAVPEPSSFTGAALVLIGVLTRYRSAGRPRLDGDARSGFTLVELLVVIAIVGVLVALLLPAIQAARETARRSQCVNNLKQIGLAFQNHEVTHDQYPSGGWSWDLPPTYSGGAAAIGNYQRAGWGFQVLPFVEGQTVQDAGAVEAIGATLPVYFCPSRRSPEAFEREDKYQPPLTNGRILHGMTDYAASNRELTGIVRRFEAVRQAEVTDGVSHTLLSADKRLNVSLLGQTQDDDNEGYTVGWNEDTIRKTSDSPRPDPTGDTDGEKLFGSSHPAGINAAFLDGSVRQVAYEIDSKVFNATGGIADGLTTEGL